MELLRWIAVFGGAIVLGLHLAVWTNADKLTFHPTAWRLFIGGNSVLTMYTMLSLIKEPNRASVLSVAFAMFVTLCGLIWLDISYRQKLQKDRYVMGRRRA